MLAFLVLLAAIPGLAQNATGEPSLMVYGETCPEAMSACEEGAQCFNHSSGACAENGTIVAEICKPAQACAPCYPHSRCGGKAPPPPADAPEEIVYGESCPEAMSACERGGPCFSHTSGACSEDGKFVFEQCKQAALCAPCYPNSRCGGARKMEPDAPEAIVYGESCPEALSACEQGAPCFSHMSGACLEDGKFALLQCMQAALCAPCYPNSRCGGKKWETTTTPTTTTTKTDEPDTATSGVKLQVQAASMFVVVVAAAIGAY